MKSRPQKKELVFTSRFRNIGKVVKTLVRFAASRTKLREDSMSVALSEAVTNAIVHGNKEDPQKRVKAQAIVKPSEVVFKIKDEGLGFAPGTIRDPTMGENIWKNHGRGIFFIKYFMDEVHYNYRGNEITMIKYVT